MSRAVARHWVGHGQHGSIINISAIGGKLGNARSGVYAASKRQFNL
jgi:NAD(P)-dependent dehydrogenase (short-subunit alcohol dehydrogenase family)